MQSSAKLESTAGPPAAAAGDWYSVSVPSTVLAGLVASGEYSNLFYADNLNRVPKNRFTVSWWYQKQVDSPAAGDAVQIWLYFQGINYRANIWLNGKKIGDANDVVGTYRDFEFNVTDAVKQRQQHVDGRSATTEEKRSGHHVRRSGPEAARSEHGFVAGGGLRTSGPLALRYPHVVSDLDVPSLTSARLTVTVDVANPTDRPVTGVLKANLGRVRIAQKSSCCRKRPVRLLRFREIS